MSEKLNSIQGIRVGKWVPEFDGLRGIAVLLVVVCHFTLGGTLLPHALGTIVSCFWFGVDLFFVVSGFLITGILVESKGRRRYWSRFVIRRALRIVPLYVLFLALGYATIGGTEDAPWYAYVFFLQNWWMGYGEGTVSLAFGITWSLAVEEQFYLIWPVVVYTCSRKGLKRVCMALIVIAPSCRLAAFLLGFEASAYYLTPCRMDALAIGALLWILVHERSVLVDVLANASTLLVPTLIVLTACGAVDRSDLFFAVFGYTFIAMTAAAVIATVFSKSSARLVRVLRYPVLCEIGKVSYGIYLLHMWVFAYVAAFISTLFNAEWQETPALALFFVAGPVLSFFVARVSWRYWEEPWLQLKDRIAP